jgi:hypothetical protein
MKTAKAMVAWGVLIVAVGALGQQAERKAAPVIGVAIESSDGRIRNWSPQLLDEATAVVEKVAKNARVIRLAGDKGTVSDAAAKKGVDYLMTIELSPRPNATISFGATPKVVEQQRGTLGSNERAQAQGSIFLSWTVQALNGKSIRLHDSRLVQAQEYPLEPNFDWLHVIASRSIRDAAAAATNKLKKKAGI